MPEGLNKVLLIGYLGADPEIRYTQSNQAVCRFRVATSESYQNKGGERQERTEWHQIVVWGKQAEIAHKYLAKGRQVYIEGRIQTRSWEDRDGKKRWSTEVVANRFLFLGGGGRGEKPAADLPEEAPPAVSEGEPFPADDDDIPF